MGFLSGTMLPSESVLQTQMALFQFKKISYACLNLRLTHGQVFFNQLDRNEPLEQDRLYNTFEIFARPVLHILRIRVNLYIPRRLVYRVNKLLI